MQRPQVAGAHGLQSSIPNKVPVEANSGVGLAENLDHHSGCAGAPQGDLVNPNGTAFSFWTSLADHSIMELVIHKEWSRT